jgi:hypothetical protein
MHLSPKLPPGRANRKALAFNAEIHRLRAVGYSFEAIRVALLDAGVEVSSTTVKREAAKRPAAAPLVQRSHAPRLPPHRPPEASAVPTATLGTTRSSPAVDSYVGDSRSGKEIAEDFMKGRITNPLMQERNHHESRRD